MGALDKLSHLIDLFDFLPLANRNYIVDGNFEQWINASTPLAANSSSYAGPTMYYIAQGVGGASTVTQNAFTPGTESVGMTSPASNFLKWNQTTASTGTFSAGTLPYMQQHVESVRTLAGRSATFSCWLWTDAGSVTVSNVIAQQYFGTGGTPSVPVTLDPTVNWVVTTTPKRFSIRLDFPSILGKTLGTNVGTDLLRIGLWLPSGTAYALNTTQWQLEQSSPQSSSDITGVGGLPTAFEYRGQQAELARVQRFYESSYDSLTSLNGSVQSISASTYLLENGTIAFKAPKRASPSMTVYSANTGAAGYTAEYNTGTVYVADRAALFQGIGTRGANVYNNNSATAGNNQLFHWTADARI